MPVYKNSTRFNAIVTIRVVATLDAKKTLAVGYASAMKDVEADVGVHDMVVGPGEKIEKKDGTDAEFVASRSLP